MFDLDHAERQIAGVWKMAIGAEDWRDHLDRSVDGVFRSFTAIPISIPLHVGLFILYYRAAGSIADLPKSDLLGAGAGLFVAAQVFSMLMDWAASLALLVAFARGLNAENRIGDVLIGYNWSQILIVLIQIVPMGAMAITGASAFGAGLGLPAIALQFAILWGVLRRGYGKDIGVTIAMLAGLVLAGVVATWAAGSLAMALL